IIIENEIIAGLNFSRMIPVEIRQLSKVDLKVRKRDNTEVKKRKETYKKELICCNEHKKIIIDKANVLYDKYVSGEFFVRRKDCLNFPELEEVCKKYNKSKNPTT
ncbi:MAG: type III toxin-antitoxin system ToxN/AbiQ family toxin, partial [Lachnospiraceae bacterium]|nr:type III toxin-antitoxin system ToxN/AbiQ family toxin [Lachnospiraceae bacterium]